MEHLDQTMSVFETDELLGIRVPRSFVEEAEVFFHERGIPLGEPVDEVPAAFDTLSGEPMQLVPAMPAEAKRENQLQGVHNVLNAFREYVGRETRRGALH